MKHCPTTKDQYEFLKKKLLLFFSRTLFFSRKGQENELSDGVRRHAKNALKTVMALSCVEVNDRKIQLKRSVARFWKCGYCVTAISHALGNKGTQ